MRRLTALLAALLLLAFTGCAANPAQPESTSGPAQADETQADFQVESAYPLEYAKEFTVDECTGGTRLITIQNARYLVVPENSTVPNGLSEDITVLQKPLENVYLVSTSAMDPILKLDARSAVTLSGTSAENWYLPEAKEAMENGEISYAGKYSAPDYERIVSANCGLAIENTMIYHTPEVKEQLEKFGVPVLVERSSYESDPLARMEWVKLYGILLGRTEEAERVFDDAVQRIAPLLDEEPTGKTAAFFSITSNNLATVRKGGDYVAKMIGLAGGSYVFADLTDSGNNLATVNISLEDFYAGARDADVLFYNSTIEGELRTMDELLAKCPMLADFKAVQSGSVWCTSQSLFQQSMELPELILDMNRVFTEDDPDDSELTFLTKLH
jgi:iron complex transport system substrate-binding protein